VTSAVSVAPSRLTRWVAGVTERHGETRLAVIDGALRGDAADGSWFVARLPFAAPYAGGADAGELAEAARARVPPDWGVLLVRKGGFAVASLQRDRLVAHKIGQRHVQGRTKAGGQSQQRFSRRRDNQARQAYEAAADHAARILEGVPTIVTGGDHAAVDNVLADRRLAGATVVPPWLAVPDPRRAVLDRAILDAQAIAVTVHNADK
jgi:hypothetical protein